MCNDGWLELKEAREERDRYKKALNNLINRATDFSYTQNDNTLRGLMEALEKSEKALDNESRG